MSWQQQRATAPLAPTTQDGLDALVDHAIARAQLARRKYGPAIGVAELEAMLADRELVRFPTVVRFDGTLLPGEFAHAEPAGGRQDLRYTIWVHPRLQERPDLLPLVVAYHLVRVNYGDIVTCDAAEWFGATLLGMDRESYYRVLCELADSLG